MTTGESLQGSKTFGDSGTCYTRKLKDEPEGDRERMLSAADSDLGNPTRARTAPSVALPGTEDGIGETCTSSDRRLGDRLHQPKRRVMGLPSAKA